MVTPAEYETYRIRNVAAIKDVLEGVGCRPVLFLGSGVSRRYISGPSWNELLEAIAAKVGLSKERFAYLSQTANGNPIALGSLLADEVHGWAWKKGQNSFPKEYFSAEVSKSIFIKHLAAELLDSLSLEAEEINPFSNELELLKRLSPHAVITTNFDALIESIFPDYKIVCGEQIIPLSMNIVGEIYKIHGTTADPQSMVLVGSDYERYKRKRKYITSKMMTYFAEYPVFIIGYGLGDPNIVEIINDLGEALKERGGFLDNVVYVEWVPDLAGLKILREEYTLASDDPALPIRMRCVVTDSFEWIFETLADLSAPVNVNTKVLRELAARVVDLVRTDVPQNQIEVNYSHIEKLLDDPSELASILGITNVKNPNAAYPYLTSQVGEALGFKGWHAVNKRISIANEKVGFDIKASDNDYHVAYKTGKKSVTHKYSEMFILLMRDILQEEGGMLPIDEGIA